MLKREYRLTLDETLFAKSAQHACQDAWSSIEIEETGSYECTLCDKCPPNDYLCPNCGGCYFCCEHGKA